MSGRIPDDVVERSKALYGPYVDADEGLRAEVESLGEGDAAYFWTMLWHEMGRRLDEVLIHGLANGRHKPSIGIPGMQAPADLPFREAEESLRAHRWFRLV